MKRHTLPLLGALLLGLPSCSTVHDLRQTASDGMYSTPFGRFLPSRCQVVQVRANALKDMPLGHDRALAYQQTRRGGFFGFLGGPVDFKEPKLPNSGAALDGTLLPPKSIE
jgi:hypothetical protein